MIKRIIAVAAAFAATIGIALAPAAAQPQSHNWPASHQARTGWVTDPAYLAKYNTPAAKLALVTCSQNSTWNGTRIIPSVNTPLPWTLCDRVGGKFVFQPDKNLVMYDPGGHAVAASGTDCCFNDEQYVYLWLQHDNNVVIVHDTPTAPPEVAWDAQTWGFTDTAGANHHDIMARDDLVNQVQKHWVDVSLRANGTNANLGDKAINGLNNLGTGGWFYGWVN